MFRSFAGGRKGIQRRGAVRRGWSVTMVLGNEFVDVEGTVAVVAGRLMAMSGTIVRACGMQMPARVDTQAHGAVVGMVVEFNHHARQNRQYQGDCKCWTERGLLHCLRVMAADSRPIFRKVTKSVPKYGTARLKNFSTPE